MPSLLFQAITGMAQWAVRARAFCSVGQQSGKLLRADVVLDCWSAAEMDIPLTAALSMATPSLDRPPPPRRMQIDRLKSADYCVRTLTRRRVTVQCSYDAADGSPGQGTRSSSDTVWSAGHHE